MRRMYQNSSYSFPQYNNVVNEERFIGPIFPFLGGALVGYIASRPQYNNSYPVYYPYYPPYPNYGYYPTPYN